MLERNGPVKGNNSSRIIIMNDFEADLRSRKKRLQHKKKLREIEDDYQAEVTKG